MNTEITEYKKELPTPDWLAYDAFCPVCRRTVAWVRPILEPRGVVLVPLQTPWVCRRLGLNPEDRAEEMVLLTHAGERLGGGEAVRYLAGRVWWAAPLAWLGLLPGGAGVVNATYRWIARNRACGMGACAIQTKPMEQEKKQRRHHAFLELP